MKEFELSEDHEFFDPVGQDVVPEDSEEQIYLQRDQIMDNLRPRLEEYLKNNRLVEIYINIEFAAPNDVSNFVNLVYTPR